MRLFVQCHIPLSNSAPKQPIERTHVQLYSRCQLRSVFTPLSHNALVWLYHLVHHTKIMPSSLSFMPRMNHECCAIANANAIMQMPCSNVPIELEMYLGSGP